MVSTISATATTGRRRQPRAERKRHSPYPLWFYLPGAIIFIVLFAIPTFASFYFSLTRWTLFDTEFIGLDNFRQFLSEPALRGSLINTFIYGFLTSGAKVVLGLLLGLLLTSQIVARGYLRSVVFFPVLVSTIGIGITFKILMDPFDGVINQFLAVFGITGPAWLTDPVAGALQHRPDRRLEGRRHRHPDLHRRPGRHPAGVLRGRPGRRGEQVAELLAHHHPAGDAGHGHGRPPVADRRSALVRADLGHHRRRARASPATSSAR